MRWKSCINNLMVSPSLLISQKGIPLKPASVATVNIILIAKVTMQAALFAEYLDKHDGKEDEPDDDSLPRI